MSRDVKALKEQIYLDFQKNPDAFIDNFTDKFYYGSGYLDGAVTGIIADAVVAEAVAGVIKGDAVTSYADLMSPKDAEKYLNFLENGSSAGLTDEEIAGIKKLDDLLALEKADYQDILNMRNADDILKGGSKSADLGNKLDYIFGKGTGNKHNIQRSQSMQIELEKIGIYDDLSGRDYLTQHLNKVLNDSSNISSVEVRSYVAKEIAGNPTIEYTATTRESLLMEPYGGVKLKTIWDGDRLLTIIVEGGR